MFELRVDNKEVLAYTKELKKMHKSNFPIAVRQTLNDLAFDVKKNTLPTQFDKTFVVRNKTFLKSHTQVEAANGWDVKQMKAIVGITPKGSRAAAGLVNQEMGGRVKKPMIYMKSSRAGNNDTKLVKLKNYVNKKGLIKGDPNMPRTPYAQFVANAVKANNEGKLLHGKTRSGTTIFEVNKITFGQRKVKRKRTYSKNGYKFSRVTKARKVKIKMTPLADYEENRNIVIEARPFLSVASKESYSRANEFYIKNAKKRMEVGRK